MTGASLGRAIGRGLGSTLVPRRYRYGGAAVYDTLDAVTIGAGLAVTGDGLVLTKTGASWVSAKGTMLKSAGKWAYEVTLTGDPAGNNIVIGVGNAAASVSSWCGSDGNSGGMLLDGARKANGGAVVGWGGGTNPWIIGMVATVLVDMDAKTLNIKQDGTLITADFDITALGAVYPMISLYENGYVVTANFGPLLHPEAGYNDGWYTL